MRKRIVLIIIFTQILIFLFSVDETTRKRFEKVQIQKAKEVEVVKFGAIKPDIERYQKKTDADLSTGFYQLYKKNLRTTNKVLLNKWLKELK